MKAAQIRMPPTVRNIQVAMPPSTATLSARAGMVCMVTSPVRADCRRVLPACRRYPPLGGRAAVVRHASRAAMPQRL